MNLGLDYFIVYAVFGIIFEIIFAVFFFKIKKQSFQNNLLKNLIYQKNNAGEYYVYDFGDKKKVSFEQERNEYEKHNKQVKESKSFFYIPFRKKKVQELQNSPSIIEKNEVNEIKNNLQQAAKFRSLNSLDNYKKESIPISEDNLSNRDNGLNTSFSKNQIAPEKTISSNDTGFILVNPASEDKKEEIKPDNSNESKPNKETNLNP